MSSNLEKFYQKDYADKALQEGLDEYENVDNQYKVLDHDYPVLFKVLQKYFSNNLQIDFKELENKKEVIDSETYGIDIIKKIEASLSEGLLSLLDSILIGTYGEKAKNYISHHLDMMNVNQDELGCEDRDGLFRVALKAVLFDTPVYQAIQQYWYYIKEDESYFDQQFLNLTGYHSGVFIENNVNINNREFELSTGEIIKADMGDQPNIDVCELGIYDILSNEYKDIFLKIKQEYSDKDMIFWLDKATYKLTNLLITASEFNDPSRSSGSSYREDLKTTLNFAKLGKGVRQRLQGMKRKIHREIDLHNIGRFIGKSGGNKYNRERKWVDREMQFVTSYPTLNSNMIKRLQEDDDQVGLEKYKKYIKTRQIEYKYLQDPEKWEQELLDKIESNFNQSDFDEWDQKLYEEKKQEAWQQIEEMRSKKQEIYKGCSLDEYKNYIFNEKTKIYNKWHNNKSLADKALDLYFETDIKEILDPINDMPFGLINRLYGFWIAGMQGHELNAYLMTELVSADKGVDRERYDNVLNNYNFYKLAFEHNYKLEDICYFTEADAEEILEKDYVLFGRVLSSFKNLDIKIFWKYFENMKSGYYSSFNKSLLSNINDTFVLDDEVKYFVDRGLLFDENLDRIRTEYFVVKDKELEEKDQAIANIIKRELAPEVKQNFEDLVEWFGAGFLFEIKNKFIDNNWHDLLLFVSHIRNKNLLDVFTKDKIRKIIQEAPTALALDEVFNQFSTDLWEEGLQRLQGKSYQYDYDRLLSYDVKGYTELKKIINIVALSAILPEGLSMDVIEKVQIMVSAPGVDFSAIKNDLEDGKIEGLLFDKELDKEALIQPLEKIYPLENINGLLKNYLQNLNKLKLAPLLGKLVKKKNLKLNLEEEKINFNLIQKIRQIDKSTKTNLKQRYAKQISEIYQDPDLDDDSKEKGKLRLREQENKEKAKSLIYPNKKTLQLENFHISDDNEAKIYLAYIKEILSDDKYKKLKDYLIKGYYQVDNLMELSFDDLENNIYIIEKLIKEILDIGVTGAQAGNQAKKLYSDLRQFLYEKHKGVSVKDYLDKDVPESDKEYLYDLLNKYKITSNNKRLVARIHKKSDPRAWVCGDYTHCCMRYGSGKNYDYMQNQNTAYFTISYETDSEDDNNIIAQSVLVAAGDFGHDSDEYLSREKDFPVIAIDNIEIANVGLKFRKQIAKIYHDIFDNNFKKKKIIMGTSFNDDGGLVSGDLTQERVKYKSLQNLKYTDCFRHNTCYVFRESKDKEIKREYNLKGLASYLLESETDVKKELLKNLGQGKLATLNRKLLKYNRGEDDGDGGLLFPHNYSRLFEYKDNKYGYILAGEFIEDPDELEYTGEIIVEDLVFFKKGEEAKLLEQWFKQLIDINKIEISAYLVDSNIEEFILSSDYIKKNFDVNMSNNRYIFISK